MATLAAPLVAQKTGIRWASTVLAPISFLSVYDPPAMPQFPALRGVTALHPAIAGALWRLGKQMSRPWVRSVDDLRKQVGLPPGEHPIFEGQHSPQLVLALFSPIFAKMQPDFPPKTRITGFVFYDGPQGQQAAPELAQFLHDGEPPILFTLGSSAVWAGSEFYRTSIETARRMNRRVILLVGDKRNLPSVALPPSIAAFDHAPYHTVMPRCACIVHQGGVGTTAQGLRAGRPMLIMPFGHDTADNARRAADLGVARVIRQKRYTVESVVKELSELLENASYNDRAKEVGARIRSENGVVAACDELEKLASQNKA
jgi:UDP:flavonoid glycosyltransferase YjiC (YdhE family)